MCVCVCVGEMKVMLHSSLFLLISCSLKTLILVDDESENSLLGGWGCGR